jgi:16S rRNA (adenine1518-N6/adenine1519-N6)-dimethyltransferase
MTAPRKRFGQNFLHDPHVVDRIVAAFAPKADERIAEIGPGTGVLTRALLATGATVHAIELDRDLVATLESRCAGAGGQLVVHSADATRFDFRALAGPEPLRVIGNLPYNVSTPLLFHLLDAGTAIAEMLFMLQREVVDRLSAAPDSADYSRLSVMVQFRCAVEKLFDVPPGAFNPPPKVTSSVVRLVPHREPLVSVRDPAHFAGIVKLAFAHPRKTLRNNLRGTLDEEALRRIDIDPGRRPGTLTLEEFARIANTR